MAVQQNHFLTDSHIQAGIALLAPFGVGVALMMGYSFGHALYWLGVFLAVVGIGATFWLGLNEIKKQTKKGFLIYGFGTIEAVIIAAMVYSNACDYFKTTSAVSITSPLLEKSASPVIDCTKSGANQQFGTIELGPGQGNGLVMPNNTKICAESFSAKNITGDSIFEYPPQLTNRPVANIPSAIRISTPGKTTPQTPPSPASQ